MNIHEKYMLRCIDIAKQGLGNVQPNPMVGSVIVYNNTIIGEGYHKKYGEPHAEVNAVNSVKDKELLKKSALYVNLEPCSHYGKTPPCAHMIVEKQIPEVIIGTTDPNKKVSGKGIEILKKAGCKVQTGILKQECEELNKRFFSFHKKKRPYIILKWAQTTDGFIDMVRKPGMEKRPVWITDEICRTLVHKWRAEEQSIIVGTNTAVNDNPSLNVRNWKGNNPLRIVIDKNKKLPEKLALTDASIPTLIFTAGKSMQTKNIEYINIDFEKNIIPGILKELYDRKIQSLIVEGGSTLLNAFIDTGLWDEARVFVGNMKFNKGIKAPHLILSEKRSIEHIGNSKLFIYKNKNLV